jgi:hypothetical protein
MEVIVNDRVRLFAVDPQEVDRYANAIAHIVERGHPVGSVELERAVNTYGTAFQLLVMRRGADYGRALGIAAGDRALTLLERPEDAEALLAGDIAAMHERVCLAEEEARERERESDA